MEFVWLSLGAHVQWNKKATTKQTKLFSSLNQIVFNSNPHDQALLEVLNITLQLSSLYVAFESVISTASLGFLHLIFHQAPKKIFIWLEQQYPQNPKIIMKTAKGFQLELPTADFYCFM